MTRLCCGSNTLDDKDADTEKNKKYDQVFGLHSAFSIASWWKGMLVIAPLVCCTVSYIRTIANGRPGCQDRSNLLWHFFFFWQSTCCLSVTKLPRV